MIVKRLMLAPAALAVVLGCALGATPGPQATPSPVPTQGPVTPAPSASGGGVEGLAADLAGAGTSAFVGSFFSSEPIGGEGRVVCVGPESVQTYAFIDHEAALAASTKINRDDPSQVGNGIVEWAGQPRFWLRDRLIVLYLGADAATDAALRALLGQPFTEGAPGRMPLPGPPCQ